MDKLNLDKHTIEFLISKGLIKREDIRKLYESQQDTTPERIDINIKQSFEEYIAYLKPQYSSNTASGYKTTVESFLLFYFDVDSISEIEGEKTPQFTTTDINKWFKHLIANSYSYASLRRFKHGLKNYFEFLLKKYGFAEPELDKVEMPDREDVDIEVLRDDEIREMVNYSHSLRDKVLILFMYETGMRRQEIIDCKKEDVDFNKKRVNIRLKNGKIDRIGYFSEGVGKLLSQYLSEWEEEIKEINDKRYMRYKAKGDKYTELVNSEYLFQTVRSPQISYSTIFKALKDTATDYFINKFLKEGYSEQEAKELTDEKVGTINTETLRHSRRAYYFSRGFSTEEVQLAMGDENKWIVKRYKKIAQQLYPERFNSVSKE